MNKLQEISYQWALYVAQMMNYDMNSFKLAQGSLGLQSKDNSGLFLIADAVPPPGKFFDAGSTKKRSSAYLSLLNALLPETNPNALYDAIGHRKYDEWVAWKFVNPPRHSESFEMYFNRWGKKHLDVERLSRADTAIRSALNTPLNLAWDALNDPNNWETFGKKPNQYELPIFSTTYANAKRAIRNGSKIEINFESNKGSRDLAVAGSTPEFSNDDALFFGRTQPETDSEKSTLVRHLGGYDVVNKRIKELETKILSQKITIAGYINKYASLPSQPVSWYSSGEVSRAYNGRGNESIWDTHVSSGGWETFFKPPNGSLIRYVSELALVSDYRLEVRINTVFSEDEFALISTFVNGGVWPLHSSSTAPEQSINFLHHRDSTITVIHELKPPSIQIWGASVQSD